MDVITAVRELGKAIQADERYLEFKKAQAANEGDMELNGLIGKLNLIQLSYQNESAKEEPTMQSLRVWTANSERSTDRSCSMKI